MRFIITSTTDAASEAGTPMSDEIFAAYMKYNEDLQTAGVLIASEGLIPGAPGARVVASRGRRKVVDGPFSESKEMVGGFYVIEAPSLEEAKAWALRCPVGMASADVLEIRQLTGTEDIPRHYLDIAASVAPQWTATITKKR